MRIQNTENRKVRSDKKERVNITTTQDTHTKLKKLAVSCGMTKTALAEDMIRLCVNHMDIVNWYQEQFNQDEQYRVKPVQKDGNLIY
ncbi:hypothetical protein ACFYKX_25670 [Cytobacillus sp. FJAT-54145]|uniref:CopG family transcriptional regulator n=1 Tax=Cytobacillus spartinae TaxID=3299023 RepID=A0ABW6KIG3_9BACI